MKEKRDIRKELRLTPSEVAAFQTAADAAGLPLATWIVQAARERLALDIIHKAAVRFNSRANAEKQR